MTCLVNTKQYPATLLTRQLQKQLRGGLKEINQTLDISGFHSVFMIRNKVTSTTTKIITSDL